MNIKIHIFTAVLVAIIITSCKEPEPVANNLVGVWELEDEINLPLNQAKSLPSVMELFGNGTGVAHGYTTKADIGIALKWKLIDGNRLQMATIFSGIESLETNDIELSEDEDLFTILYDGRDFKGERPRKAKYRKRENYRITGFYTDAPLSLTDTRDGKTYRVVKINNQTWMAENLNYEIAGSKCYNNEPANCEKYGRLYNWEAAAKACPSGWHLPSNTSWDRLYRHADDISGVERRYRSETAGKYLKAKEGWEPNDSREKNTHNGTDKFEFTALPAGSCSASGNFMRIGYDGFWWSASESNAGNAYYRRMEHNNESAIWGKYNKAHLYSVRCLKD